MLSGPTSFLGLMLLMSYVPLVEDDKKMAANQFARNSSTVKEGNEVSNELLKRKPNIQQIVHGTEGHMAVYGPVRHQINIIWTEASEVHIILFW
jgi:hypothetical protein